MQFAAAGGPRIRAGRIGREEPLRGDLGQEEEQGVAGALPGQLVGIDVRLSGLQPPEQLEALVAAAGVSLQQRPQELAPSAWVALATGLNRLNA